MSKRISYKVEGVVQGVNFRAWTTQKAKGLNVTGFVKNADDGSVIGEAQGSDAALDKFVQHLSLGPSAAQVSRVEKQEMETKGEERAFNQIRR